MSHKLEVILVLHFDGTLHFVLNYLRNNIKFVYFEVSVDYPLNIRFCLSFNYKQMVILIFMENEGTDYTYTMHWSLAH